MRRAFLMLFGGAAWAQLPNVKVCVSEGCPLEGRKRYKPKNGECPVCGEMAPTLKARLTAYRMHLDRPLNEPIMEPIYETDSTRIVRCAHCSNAFYQDAEVAK